MKVVTRMEAAIERRRNPDGAQPTFSLVIDAIKVSSVLEMSHGHKAIFDGEFPSHIIDIAGKTKECIRDFWMESLMSTKRSILLQRSRLL